MDMDANQIRRLNINHLAEKLGDRGELARRLGYEDTNYLNQLCKGHGSFGDRTARKIEQSLGLKRGWMDHFHYQDYSPKLLAGSISEQLRDYPELQEPGLETFTELVDEATDLYPEEMREALTYIQYLRSRRPDVET